MAVSLVLLKLLFSLIFVFNFSVASISNQPNIRRNLFHDFNDFCFLFRCFEYDVEHDLNSNESSSIIIIVAMHYTFVTIKIIQIAH